MSIDNVIEWCRDNKYSYTFFSSVIIDSIAKYSNYLFNHNSIEAVFLEFMIPFFYYIEFIIFIDQKISHMERIKLLLCSSLANSIAVFFVLNYIV